MRDNAGVKIIETINGYERLLNIIENHQDKENICRLSKKEISALYGLSYTGTLKKLKFLVKYKLLKQVDGGLMRTDKDVRNDSPLSLLQEIMLLVSERPEIHSSFKQQAEILDVSFEDVRSAWGFYGYLFGSKYKE
ncbi:hypothetical protein M3649_19315 [Ureibacillus chungkukjangi]|uniref:hypothetical protein n=1 Tax=Ureibacillus chungkukjangi TaxID=1202712 RepID=UPI00203CCCE5|nr:hypothetical protein [Ureibacillus chungkukjangi]MCM3390251.1 hypothetical protein [Ureibacillus chungkukjangi]